MQDVRRMADAFPEPDYRIDLAVLGTSHGGTDE
jgi:hypothetical protein